MRMPVFLERDRTFTEPIIWVTTSVMVAIHIGAVAALFMFSWRAFSLAIVLCWVAGSLGTGMGYHHLLTHRGYKTPKWTEYFLPVCGLLALQGGPIFWVATHRLHHQNADKDGDPHSPRDGGLWSHIGWILTGRTMSDYSTALLPDVPDLRKDKFHVWISRWHGCQMSQSPWSFLLREDGHTYCGLVASARCLVSKSTWLVNSATHM